MGDHAFGVELGLEIAARKAVDADDRDVHQVRRLSLWLFLRCGAHEVPGRLRVSLPIAGAVHDRRGSLRGRAQPFAGGQVTGGEHQAVLAGVAAPTQHQDLPARRSQPRYDLLAERTGPAGDQDGRQGHGLLLCLGAFQDHIGH
jgi:hypothetical protein